MTEPMPELRDLSAVMTALAALPAQLTGKEGKAIREHVEKLAQILGAQGPEAELRGRAAAELEQLVAAITRLVDRGARAGKRPQAGGLDLGELAGGLRTFAAFLRAPTEANQAEALRLVATLHGTAAPRPVPLDELDISGTVEELAIESARRHGLQGAEARRAAERMKREMTALVRQLELRAQQEASRARTAADMERLLGQVVQTGTPLAQALAHERASIIAAFRRVDLAHMAEGLRVFGEWLSTPADDGAAHVAVLRAQLAETLGPPTAGDPARSEDERRADFEREIKVAVDEIFRGSGRGSGHGSEGGAGPAS
jgi:hypothetical protein